MRAWPSPARACGACRRSRPSACAAAAAGSRSATRARRGDRRSRPARRRNRPLLGCGTTAPLSPWAMDRVSSSIGTRPSAGISFAVLLLGLLGVGRDVSARSRPGHVRTYVRLWPTSWLQVVTRSLALGAAFRPARARTSSGMAGGETLIMRDPASLRTGSPLGAMSPRGRVPVVRACARPGTPACPRQ